MAWRSMVLQSTVLQWQEQHETALRSLVLQWTALRSMAAQWTDPAWAGWLAK
jgi:hypothetical protein